MTYNYYTNAIIILQNFKQVFRDLEQEIAELQQQLFSSEEETKLVRQQLEELSRREETLMREMREQVS